MAGGILHVFGSGDKEELRSKTRKRRKWVNRVSELRTGGKVINCAFLSSVSSLVFSFLLRYFIGSWPGINAVSTGFTTSVLQPSECGVSLCTGSTERLLYGAIW